MLRPTTSYPTLPHDTLAKGPLAARSPWHSQDQCAKRLASDHVPARYRTSRPASFRWHKVSHHPMKFRSLHNRVVIRRVNAEEKSAGGIIIPDTAQEKPMEGEAVAVEVERSVNGAAPPTRPRRARSFSLVGQVVSETIAAPVLSRAVIDRSRRDPHRGISALAEPSRASSFEGELRTSCQGRLGLHICASLSMSVLHAGNRFYRCTSQGWGKSHSQSAER
jgi:Chaperonin 10 Kd subunit